MSVTCLSFVGYKIAWSLRTMETNHESSYPGSRNRKSGYESLVEAARAASHKFNPIQQREVVIQALERAFPRPILSLASPFISSIYLLSCMQL